MAVVMLTIYQDIGIHNVVVAELTPSVVRFLLIDFEMAQYLPFEKSPRIDIWWQINLPEVNRPPFGLEELDPFAYDVFRTGMAIGSAIRVRSL
jgi:hypothetical protein